MSMIGFPLLLIPLAIYNIIVFLMPGVSFAEPIVKLSLMSGAEWPLTLSDMLVALGILLLLFEVMKGARPGAKYLTDHFLSLIVFVAAVAEFLLWPRFGGSTYFLLALLSLVDFLSGLALRVRRKEVVKALARAPVTNAPVTSVSTRSEPVAQKIEVAPEPRFDAGPPPVPPIPAAASVAESVLSERPELKISNPAAATTRPSPEVVSPGLQPGESASPSPETPSR